MSRDYPKCMTHPANVPAVIGERQTDRYGRVSYGQSRPERFPKTWVESEEQEEEARSRGYLPMGEVPTYPVGFSEYPLMMAHPDHRDAIPDEIKAERKEDGSISTWVIPGKPEEYPSVCVRDAQEEADWATKGYMRMGVSDPDAVSAAHAGYVPGVERTQYPKWVDGRLIQDPAISTSGVAQYPKWIASHERVVDSPEEEAELLGLPAPVQPVEAPQADPKDDRIAELERELADLRKNQQVQQIQQIQQIQQKQPDKPPKRTRSEAQQARRARERGE